MQVYECSGEAEFMSMVEIGLSVKPKRSGMLNSFFFKMYAKSRRFRGNETSAIGKLCVIELEYSKCKC